MNKHIKYLLYIIKHKFYVTRECFKMGLYWRGLMHDMSKFSPIEWFAYVEYFYGGWSLEYSPDVVFAFNKAWLHHQHNNKHHYQHWILRNDDGTVMVLPMPKQYAKEMVCDWIGAGLAITGKRGFKEWYANNREKIILHDATRSYVENLLNVIQ